MLTETQIKEVREHLERAQNPLFYYDNDADGLCSFIILRKFIERGKGVAVRSFPDLNASYARKAQELNSDYIFVLDKPAISEQFMEEIEKLGLPLVWIDHHDVPPEDFEKKFKNLFVYNSERNKEKSGEPVTYLSYKIVNRKEYAWLGIIGCIADHYLPDFVSTFKEQCPDFWGQVKDPFDAYYKTEIGKVAQALNFGLKDSISNVIKLQNFLISSKGPGEIFLETPSNYTLRKKHFEIKEKYKVLLEKAKKGVSDGIIFFIYSGELSISAELSNELSYIYPDKYVIVAYKRGEITNLSIRGKNVKKILEDVLKNLEDSSGGGHEDAVGARIRTEDLKKCKEMFEKEIKK